MNDARASAVLKRAVIIAVGSELLTPNRIDTNSLFLTTHLNALGIGVSQKFVVGDEPVDLSDTLQYAIGRSDLVVTTGGLGPTEDDLTREAVSTCLGLPLEEKPKLIEAIQARFADRGLEMPAINSRQALVPAGAIVIPNAHGTAPGLWIDHESTVILLLPGPPRELRPMFEQLAHDRLSARSDGRRIYRRVLRITGRTESYVEELTQPVYAKWYAGRPSVKTTILASLGQIELHLSTTDANVSVAESVLDDATVELDGVLGKDLISTDGSSLEEVTGSLLCEEGVRVAVAESCTGGLVASRLTDVPGSSAYMHAGWTLYSNEAKIALLGVDERLIHKHGSVSEEVAEAMAVGARHLAGVEFGLGVTGIAGPGGGSNEKPIGTVCMALAGPDGSTRTRRLQLSGERDRVKFQASQAVLDMLRRTLMRRRQSR